MTVPGTPAGQQNVRRHNLSLITGALTGVSASRAELAHRTGLTKATVSSLVDALLLQGILVEGDPSSAGVGRPARPVMLNAQGPVGLGVEINVDYLAVLAADLTGQARGHRHVKVDNRDRPVAETVAQAGGLCREVLAEVELPLLGAGLALPGVVDANGELLRAPNLPGLTGSGVGALLARELGASRLIVDNEANLGALARLWSAPVAGRDFVYVSGEIGVGAGLVVGGELFRGYGGFAGELGHVVVDSDGPSCGCGGQGCVEQYAGQDVLLRAAGQADLASLEAAVAASDPQALSAVAAAGSALGVGLSSLLNVFDLPTVVLGGVYARLFDAITPSLAAELGRRVLSPRTFGGELLRSTLGVDAAVRGAAGAVVDRALRDPGSVNGQIGR